MTAARTHIPTGERLLELVGSDLEVPLVGGEWVRYANLDNAASAPALTQVADAVAELLPYLPIPATPADALSALEAQLRSLGRDALVSVTGASNVTGEVWPIEAITRIAHRHGARVALDAAQLAAHRPLDIAAWDVDYVAFSGHKIYAPYGAGVLAGRADWLDAGRPHLAGGGAVRSVTADAVEWATGPARHEGGTPAALGAFAIAAAARALGETGWEQIQAHEQDLLERLLTGLDAIGGVRTYELWERGHDRVGVVSFNVDGLDPALLAAALGAEHGIGVRDGAFCAHPLMDHFAAGGPRDAVRASIGVGTSAHDIDRLLSAVEDISRHGTRWNYVERGAYVLPDPDPRPRPSLGGLLDGPVAAGKSACRG